MVVWYCCHYLLKIISYDIWCMIVVMSPLLFSTIFFSLSLTILLSFCVKWSIKLLSRLSEVNHHLASHQFIINQVYQIRRKILQDINYNFTESRKSKIGEIWLSKNWFHLVHSSVQVPTWCWSKYRRGFIWTMGLCIGFSDIVAFVGQ